MTAQFTAADVERIAKGLTKAQRVVLSAAPETGSVPHSYWHDRLIASGGAVAQSLCLRGLMLRHFALRPARRHARYETTPLGLAVRAHFMQEERG